MKLPHTLEFTSSAPVLDLVRQGITFAIITSMCLSTVPHLKPGNISLVPLPWIPYFRQIDIASPSERLLDLPDRIARLCWSILDTNVLPKIYRLAPFTRPLISTGAPEDEQEDPPRRKASG
ncbi:hypothetical protein [Breoghania sp.]|uniref:hypothetical protein n=1 Tax=Breoghania sp. TaxID=2065378 RepID=UPI002602C44F|nr:hypothetical protein [Breoghania sp.]MDJ0931316.1 hypothetical protein [Breoghania sp.]